MEIKVKRCLKVPNHWSTRSWFQNGAIVLFAVCCVVCVQHFYCQQTNIKCFWMFLNFFKNILKHFYCRQTNIKCFPLSFYCRVICGWSLPRNKIAPSQSLEISWNESQSLFLGGGIFSDTHHFGKQCHLGLGKPNNTKAEIVLLYLYLYLYLYCIWSYLVVLYYTIIG